MLNISLSGMLWTVVNLLVLYVLIRKFLWKPVTAIMESRQKEIDDNLASADSQRAEAEALKAQYDAALAQAGIAAAEVVAKAKARGERKYQNILEAAQADAKKAAEANEKQMEADREAMLWGARKEVAALALLAAAKVSQKVVDTDTDRALVDDFLSGAGDLL